MANNTDGLNVAEFTYHQHRRIAMAGMIVSLGGFAWALVYLFRLAREMLDDDAAAGAVAMCCAYPFSLFYSAFYTESIFLLTLAGTFYHFRRREWFPAAAWGFGAGPDTAERMSHQRTARGAGAAAVARRRQGERLVAARRVRAG